MVNSGTYITERLLEGNILYIDRIIYTDMYGTEPFGYRFRRHRKGESGEIQILISTF